MLIAIWILAWAGLGLSLELTRIYYNYYQDPRYSAGCQISETIDCKAVALSKYAKLLGLPNSLYGSVFYGLILIIIPFRLRTRVRIFQNLELYVAALAILSLVMTVDLAYSSFFVLKKICVWCTCLYAVDLGFLVLAILALGSPREAGAKAKEDLALLRTDQRVLAGAVAGGILVLVLALFLYHRSQQVVDLFPEVGISGGISISGDPVVGPSRAPVTIIEFSDFQCPYCRDLYQSLKQYQEKHPSQVRVVFKNFPLDGSCNPMLKGTPHPNSCLAAIASECANQLGFFEAFSDKLMSAGNFSMPVLMGMASESGADLNRFQACITSGQAQQEVLNDIREAIKLKITGTPLMVINGRIVRKALSEEELEIVIRRIKEGKELPAQQE